MTTSSSIVERKSMLASSTVSIIVPVYNTKKYLSDCIDSITNQSYENLEIILVDDGSSDGSLEICNQYAKTDNRIKVVCKDNGGVSSARNVGLRIAKGEYISFIDSDDFMDCCFCEAMIKALKETCADIAICKFRCVPDNEKYNVDKNCECSKRADVLEFKDIAEAFNSTRGDNGNYFSLPSNKMFRKSIISKLSFREDITMGEDLVFNTESLLLAKKVCFVNEFVYNYRIREGSAVRSLDIKKIKDAIKAHDHVLCMLNGKIKRYSWDRLLKEEYDWVVRYNNIKRIKKDNHIMTMEKTIYKYLVTSKSLNMAEKMKLLLRHALLLLGAASC